MLLFQCKTAKPQIKNPDGTSGNFEASSKFHLLALVAAPMQMYQFYTLSPRDNNIDHYASPGRIIGQYAIRPGHNLLCKHEVKILNSFLMFR